MALPSGYKRLLYIRSSGAQYINTEFNPKYNTRVVMKISDVDTSIDNQWFFGARDGTSASVKNRFTLYKIGETVRSDYFGTSVTVDVSDFTGSTTIDKNGNVASVYGETITNTAVSSGACTYPLFLFVLNNAGNPHRNYASYSLESCQIYDGSTLVRNFIPCTNASGEAGLWDDVNSKFYANAGTGTFTAGPTIGALPAGYTQLEYISASGKQYIDTGFNPNQDTSVRATVSGWDAASTSSSIFGSRESASSIAYLVMVNAGGAFRSDYGSSKLTFDSANAVEKTEIYKNKNVCSIGSSTVTNVVSAFSCPHSMYLCGTNTGGSLSHGFVGNLHSCQIYDNGTLVRDFIPCTNAAGEVGLWDGINGVFYKNAGTGSFVAGPEVGSSGASGYTVNITGNLSPSYGYATINDTKITTTGTKTYASKPTISVYVGGSYLGGSNCKVTLNGATVKSGSGSYTVDIGDDDTVNINFNVNGSGYSQYYTCDITTETSTPPDHMAPHDGHNTNIGQVACQVEAGTVLNGGVSREIESGVMLVNGVEREIAFDDGIYTIFFSGADKYGENDCYMEINGVRYSNWMQHYDGYSAFPDTMELEKGTTIYIEAGGGSASSAKKSITLNGDYVGTDFAGSYRKYSYLVQSDASISMGYNTSRGGDYVDITEQ